jgi:hypothetical protein
MRAVETGWRNVFGDAPITLLRRALEEVAEAAGRTKGAARSDPGWITGNSDPTAATSPD